jgi:uncharacterized membrane protein YfcA
VIASTGMSIALLLTIALAFVCGGTVKGALGVGLPLVVVPLLSLALPTPRAIAMVAIPVIASNLWQAWDTGVARASLRRFFPLLACLLIGTLLTVSWTLSLPLRWLNIMLAVMLVIAVLLMAFKPQINVSPEREKLSSAVVGAVSGFMGGISSLTGPVIICYLMALRLSREEFVGTISVIYLFGAVPLYASMAVYGHLGLTELMLSTVALLPMAAGMAIGKRLRGRLSEVVFQRVLFTFLCLIAVALVVR